MPERRERPAPPERRAAQEALDPQVLQVQWAQSDPREKRDLLVLSVRLEMLALPVPQAPREKQALLVLRD